MATLFGLLCDGAIHPVVIDRLPLASAREVHTRIDSGGLGGKIVLSPWPASPEPAVPLDVSMENNETGR